MDRELGGHLRGRPELTRYARVRRAGAFLFLSGVSSRRPDGTIRGAGAHPTGAPLLDVRSQTEGAIENLRTALEAHGATLADVVDLTCFLVHMNDYGGFNEVFNRHFADAPPARTTVAVHQLPDPALCVELKAVAYKP